MIAFRASAALSAAAFLLVSVDAFGPFGPKCNTYMDQRSCTVKSACAWCNSTDVDSTGTPLDELCFSTKSASKLNKTQWTCSGSGSASGTLRVAEAPPVKSYYSLFQQSDAKHCVELDVDSESSKNASCFQSFWAGTFFLLLLRHLVSAPTYILLF